MPTDAVCRRDKQGVGAEQGALVPEPDIATPGLEPQSAQTGRSRLPRSSEHRQKAVVQYELPAHLPGLGRLSRRYCLSTDSAGVGRWIVDVRIPVSPMMLP